MAIAKMESEELNPPMGFDRDIGEQALWNLYMVAKGSALLLSNVPDHLAAEKHETFCSGIAVALEAVTKRVGIYYFQDADAAVNADDTFACHRAYVLEQKLAKLRPLVEEEHKKHEEWQQKHGRAL